MSSGKIIYEGNDLEAPKKSKSSSWPYIEGRIMEFGFCNLKTAGGRATHRHERYQEQTSLPPIYLAIGKCDYCVLV
jgi:hypothetical protein